MEWIYQGKPVEDNLLDDESLVGFVYLITNTDSGMKYVGKKNFTRSKTYQKNKKKRKMRLDISIP